MKKTFSLLAVMATVLTLAFVLMSAGKKQQRLFMVGDSTMADKTELEASPERGWGQLFPSFLDDEIVVENHAMNGRSTKSFQDEGRWSYVLNRMGKGDVLILQFGHNDAKRSDSTRFASVEEYKHNLIKMGRQAREKGVDVIICSPINRRSFKDGHFEMTHGDYPAAACEAAKELQVPYLDMEKATRDWLIELGDEASVPYFMNVKAGECTKFPEGKVDNTHLRENGALSVGYMAAKLISQQKIACLKKHVVLRNVDGCAFQSKKNKVGKPLYTTFCRPSLSSDKKLTESDMKKF